MVKPNVLFIMSDQHRFDYMSCAGSDFINTPDLDRLAAMGVKFTHCFTNSPICAPARIALATGLQPFRTGALDNQSFLPVEHPNMYKRFRDHGYRTGCIGKLDLAKPDGYNGRYGDRPKVYGFGFTHPEECEGKMHAGNSDTPLGPYNFYLQEKGLFKKFRADYKKRAKAGWRAGPDCDHDSVLPTEDFEDIYIGRRAAEWIEKTPDDFPWFYFVSFVGPHDPFDPPTEYADKYRDKNMPAAIRGEDSNRPAWIQNRQKEYDDRTVAVTRRQYCASTEANDCGIGLMLDVLEKRGQLENTIIIYTSDHGEMLGDHGLYTKHCAYEPSMRVPLIVAGPGIKGGRVSDALIELIDCNAASCELAGIGVPENLDAQSFVPVLNGETDTHRSEVITMERNYRAVRNHDYKLIENYNDKLELYDMREDPEERQNIIDDNWDKTKELKKRMTARFTEGECLRL